MTTIVVPRLHYDDFVRHRGWWCVMDNPGLKQGDMAVFSLVGGPVPYLQQLTAEVSDCFLVKGDEVGVPKDLLVGWWCVHYKGEFIEPAPIRGDPNYNATQAEQEYPTRIIDRWKAGGGR